MIKTLILFGVRNDMFDGRYLYLFIGNIASWVFNDYLVPVSLFLQAFHHYKIHLNVVCFSCMFYLHIDCKGKQIRIIQFFFSQEDQEGHWRECLMVCMSWLFGRPFCCQNIFYMYIPWFKISLLNGNLIFKLIEIQTSAV